MMWGGMAIPTNFALTYSDLRLRERVPRRLSGVSLSLSWRGSLRERSTPVGSRSESGHGVSENDGVPHRVGPDHGLKGEDIP